MHHINKHNTLDTTVVALTDVTCCVTAAQLNQNPAGNGGSPAPPAPPPPPAFAAFFALALRNAVLEKSPNL